MLEWVLKRIFSFVILVVIINVSRAELGGQRSATTIMNFLKMEIGARGSAMGGSYTAVAQGAEAVFWNPAGLSLMESSGAAVSYQTLPADLFIHSASFVYKLNDGYSFAVSWAQLSMDDMEITTIYHPEGNGSFFQYKNSFISLSLSRKFTDQFSFGINGKFLKEDYGVDGIDSKGYAIDLGTLYYTGFKSLRLGSSLSNFGPNIRPQGSYEYKNQEGVPVKEDYDDFPLPTVFKLSAAMELIDLPMQKFTASIQMNHPVDNAENFQMGCEYSFHHTLFSDKISL